jgi:hypothetical protein
MLRETKVDMGRLSWLSRYLKMISDQCFAIDPLTPTVAEEKKFDRIFVGALGHRPMTPPKPKIVVQSRRRASNHHCRSIA